MFRLLATWVEFGKDRSVQSEVACQKWPVRSGLSPLLQNNGLQLDGESLRTFICEVEAIINSRPLTVDLLNDPGLLSTLTPNHLLTMKAKVVFSPPGVFTSADKFYRKRQRRVQHLANEFWCRWRREYLLSLQQRQWWTVSRNDVGVGDIVIIKDDNSPRSHWQLARVCAVNRSSDTRVCTVKLALADACLDKEGRRVNEVRFLERPVQKLVLLWLTMTMKVNPGVYPSRGAIDFVNQSFDSFNHEHLRFFFIMFIFP